MGLIDLALQELFKRDMQIQSIHIDKNCAKNDYYIAALCSFLRNVHINIVHIVF